MKKTVLIALMLALLSGCTSAGTTDENGRIIAEDGRILLDNVYSSEKIENLTDGGAYIMAPVNGEMYFSGYNETDYDVFRYDGSGTEGLEYGLCGTPFGIGASDSGLALVNYEYTREEGTKLILYFTEGDVLSEGIDFTNALSGIAEEIELNGMPDFTVGKIPDGAAVSDGRNVALVYKDGRTDRLDLPGSIMSVTASAEGELCLYLVNSVADRFVYTLSDGELKLMSDDIPEMKSVAIYKSGSDLFMLTEAGFYRIEKGKAELMLNFEHSSVVWSDNYCFSVLSQDEIYYSGINDITKDNGLYRLTPEENQYRRVIDVLNFSDDALDTFAMMFNASQSEYFVTGARPQAETASDRGNLISEFDKKLLSGDCGDLVCLDSGIDWEVYANQRIFADLSHLFADGELFDCVTDALERDGKLYTVCRSFNLRTMYSLDEYWNSHDMTPEELIRYAEALDEESRPFWSMSKSNVQNILLSGMGAYMDTDDRFGCSSFMDSLRYIASMPDEYDTRGRASGSDIYVNGEVRFILGNIYSLETWLDYQRFEADGMKFTETGYPTRDGGRAVIQPFEFYAIPADADEREGAKAFLSFLMDCHTRMGDMGIPADVSAFRDKMESAKAYYFEYEPGQIMFGFAGRIENYDPENENLEPVTDELIAEFEAWLTDIECALPLDTELESIINEEIGAYLAGLCTAEECADRINSRVGLYVSERG